MTHPYKTIEWFQNWNRAVANSNLVNITPALHSDFTLTKEMRIMSLGSCFAQHITRHLSTLGFTKLFYESGPPEDESYRVFSGRYGNIYTMKQALQLLNRAIDGDSSEESWMDGDKFIDPYRPNAVPGGFETSAKMLEDKKHHLQAVKELFLDSDLIILTLGLTEGWVNLTTGTVYPVAPGVSAGEYQPGLHDFFNQNISQVIEDLFSFINRIKSMNAKVRFILTVSPVPLAATYEKMHVMNATSYSKSVLRVAAQEAVNQFDFVYYFPSFEMVTSQLAQGSYYENDFRHVKQVGVNRVMNEFERVFVKEKDSENSHESIDLFNNYQRSSRIICDEDAILDPMTPGPELNENTQNKKSSYLARYLKRSL